MDLRIEAFLEACYLLTLGSKLDNQFSASFSHKDDFTKLQQKTKFSEEEVKEIYEKFKQKTKGQLYLDQASFYELIFFGQEDVGVLSNRIFKSIDNSGQGMVSKSLNLDQLHGVPAFLQCSYQWRHAREG